MSKAMRVILIVVLVILLGCGGFAWYTIAQLQRGATQTVAAPEGWLDETVDVESLSEPTPSPTPGPADIVTMDAPAATEMPIYEMDENASDVINILLVGTDSRAVTNDAEGRSDTMMVASYNMKENKIYLTSFMRDAYVTRIGEKSRFKGKLNAAYTNGGVGELINTLNYNFGLDIQDYISVGFSGFWVLVDGFGGVSVDMNKDEAYRCNWRCAGLLKNDNKRNYKEILARDGKSILEDEYEGVKTQTLYGEQALWYCRDRYSDFNAEDGTVIGGGDAARIARQQYLIRTLYKTILSADMTFGELWSIYQYASQWMNTNMDLDTIMTLGTAIVSGDPEIEYIRIPEQYKIEREVNEETGVESERMTFDIDDAKEALLTTIYGAVPTPTPKPEN